MLHGAAPAVPAALQAAAGQQDVYCHEPREGSYSNAAGGYGCNLTAARQAGEQEARSAVSGGGFDYPEPLLSWSSKHNGSVDVAQ